MTTTPGEPVSDDDIETTGGSHGLADSADADGADDTDAAAGDTDGTDGGDADGTDGGDADSTDA